MLLVENYLIETEKTENGWRWKYTSLLDGADRYSAKKFPSQAECKAAATEFVKKFNAQVAQFEQKLLGQNASPIFDRPD